MQQHLRLAARRPSALWLGMAAVALGSMPLAATAATIDVAAGVSLIADDDQCSLAEAIDNANADAQVNNDDCVAGAGSDVLNLAPGASYVLTTPLPTVVSPISIEGNSSVIERAGSAGCNSDGVLDPGEFRLLLLMSGELALRDLTLRNGCADGPSSQTAVRGAAVSAFESVLVLERVVIENNRARDTGGGIHANLTDATIIDSILRENSALGGGGAIHGIGFSSVTISGSTISANTAGGAGGGGIRNAGSMTIVNSTISGNESMPSFEFSGGGGVSSIAQLTLVNVTITGNSDDFGTGVGGGGIAFEGTLSIRNSMIVDNPQGGDCVWLTGSFQADGANLDTDGSCAGLDPADVTTVTPSALALGPLQDNGGPTPTHLPGPGSAAVDAVPLCTYLAEPLTIDQRGVVRPQLDGCDLGAVEVGPLPDEIFADGFEPAGG